MSSLHFLIEASEPPGPALDFFATTLADYYYTFTVPGLHDAIDVCF